jgi:hypothetical protein
VGCSCCPERYTPGGCLAPAFAGVPRFAVDLPAAVDLPVELAIGVLAAAMDLLAVVLGVLGLAGAGALIAFEAGDLVVVGFFAAVDFAGTVDWALDGCKTVIAARAAMTATGSGMASRRKDPV